MYEVIIGIMVKANLYIFWKWWKSRKFQILRGKKFSTLLIPFIENIE